MTAREPAQLVLANVHYHLGQGASEVHVFLDDPDDPAGAFLSEVANCQVYRCDAEHWARVNKGRRPERQTRRQAVNATYVYRETGVDWLIHLDADEFLYHHRPLSEELKYAPQTPGYLALQVRERAFAGPQKDLFEGVFRVPFTGRNALNAQLFGELTPFQTHGVSGHAAGKSCVPTGMDYRISIHAPRTLSGKRLPPLQSSSTVLLHFDGLTRLHWIVKMLRYQAGKPEGLVGPHRLAQLEFMRDGCQDLSEIAEFHDMLKAVDDEECARLSALGLLEHLPFDVGGAARGAVTTAGLSLEAKAFDAELRKRNADLLAVLGK